MAKVFETFKHDIKRKFDDVMTVEDSDSIKAIDIEEYVLTQNVEEILGNFVAYFFDDEKEYPELRMKTQLLQDTYRDKIGPGVWIRGFFGAGKSHLLKVIYTIFSKKEISYIDENGTQKELNVIDSICSKIRSSEVTELVKNIHPEDYLTFIFSANHIAKSGDTVVDCLPKEISRQLNLEYDEDKTYSAMDVAEFLKATLKGSGKRRMLIFIDEILDLLDNADKVRKFEGLVELLPDNIWMVVTSLEAKTKLLDTVSAERMIHRFGEEQILKPEEMVWIVKNRYLAKNEKCSEIESIVNIDKMKYIFGTALYTAKYKDAIENVRIAKSIDKILAEHTGGNPRNIKRFINMLLLRTEIARNRGFDPNELKMAVLAKMMLIEQYNNDFYKALADEIDEEGHCKAFQITSEQELDEAKTEVNETDMSNNTSEGNEKKTKSKKETKTVTKTVCEKEADSIIVRNEQFKLFLQQEDIKAWMQIEPSLAGIDLRPYYFACTERIDFFFSSPEERLRELASVVRAGSFNTLNKKEEISALNTSDAKQLLKIVSQDVFVRDLSESQPPKSIEGIRCLVEYHSELQEDLVDFLLTLPFDKLGIWAVGGWDSCIPKTSNVRDKLRLFFKNVEESTTNPIIKSAAKESQR